MMRKILAASAALTIAACSGGSHPLPAPSSKATATYASATFVMHWPAASTQSSLRRPKYISPSTKSIAIEINNDSTLTTIANNPSTGQATTSNVTVAAPGGSDTITFSLYDGAGATGNELGQITVAQTIVAGQVNAINAIIDGIVSSVELDPLPNQPMVTSATDSSGTVKYTLAGDFPVTFAAKPKDADGNVILGPGAPIDFSVTSANTGLSVTPVNGQSNQFTVQVSKMPRPGAAFGLVAHASDLLGNSAQSNYPVNLAPLTYIAYQNSGTGTVAAFDSQGRNITLAAGFPGLIKPLGIASDVINHRIYALDGASSRVLAFNTDGTAASGFTAPTVAGATNLMFDYNTNQLYVTSSSNTVSVFKADGSPTTVAGTFGGLNGPVAITLYDAQPTFFIFVANAANNTYSTYNEDGTPAPFGEVGASSFSTGTQQPSGIATDNSGMILVAGTDSGNSDVQLYSLLGTSGVVQTTSVSGPAGVTYNPFDTNYYVANQTSGNVTVYDSQLAGLVTTIAAPSGLSRPVATAFVY